MNPYKRLALGILVVVIGSLLLAWSILTDAAVLTVFDGQQVRITREGKEFKFMYDANSSWITQTGDVGGSSGFLADTRGSFWLSWEDGTHILYGKIVSVNARFVVLLLTNGAGETIIDTGPLVPYRVTNLEFIDGGTGSDTILATVESELLAINITGGYVNGNATTISGSLTVPEGETGRVLLTLPSGTLVAGREYRLELKLSRKDALPLFASKRYVFYHMYHPDTPGLVEEGVITDLFPSYYSRYAPDADCMTCTVQNTGDFAITITGGFINGHAARNTTELTIEKGESGQVTMYFAPASLMDRMNNKVPFLVKLVTARDNIIAYAEPYYYPDPRHYFGENYSIPDLPVILEEGEITNLQFTDGGTGNDLIIASLRNSGSASINITSCLVNGRAAYFLPPVVVIPPGGTENLTLPLPGGTFVGSETYQVVLITSNSNAFVRTSSYG